VICLTYWLIALVALHFTYHAPRILDSKYTNVQSTIQQRLPSDSKISVEIYTPSGRIVSCGDLWRLLSLEGRVMGEWQASRWTIRAI
jgi:hypothetical protein